MNKELVDKICNAALDKKAENVVVMDIGDMTVVADNFIIYHRLLFFLAHTTTSKTAENEKRSYAQGNSLSYF